jgi:mRNA interferase MazF
VNAGDVVLIPLPSLGGGAPELRPALVVATLPGPYQTLLICGISSQLANLISGWDELIQPGDPDFTTSR